MINWNEVRASRPAKAACRAWLDQNLTDGKFWRTLSKLGLKQQAKEVYKYLIRYRHKDLAKNMRSALFMPESTFTDDYDDNSNLSGGQGNLPDHLQRAIIQSKTGKKPKKEGYSMKEGENMEDEGNELAMEGGCMKEGDNTEDTGDEGDSDSDSIEESVRPIVMDSKKFLKFLNSGAQAKIHMIGEKVKEMGSSIGKNYELASLNSNSLVFEDRDTNTYYMADVSSNNGKLTFGNIKPVRVVETGIKASEYEKALVGLVESISANNVEKADKMFGILSGGFKFKNKVIPESGIIHLRDGSTRKVSVGNRVVNESISGKIGRALRKALSNDVNIMEGRVVSASFSTNANKIKIPINDWTRCRLRANEMREVAMEAYKSPAFSQLVKTCAGFVSEGDLKSAVVEAREILEEQQEFCLLTSNEFTTLIENALATHAEFNPFIARDTAKLLYRAALKLNREDIVESWQRSAQISSESALFEEAGQLSRANNTSDFEAQYEGFLDGVFNESEDVLASKAKVYRMCLQILSSVLSNVETSQQEADALTQMAEALSETPDHATIMQAEELLAQISDDIIDAVETLHTFDSKEEEEDDSEDEEEMGEEPVELPDMEGEMEEPEAEVPEPETGSEGAVGEGEGEIGIGAPEEEGAAAPPLPESKSLNRMTINERRQYALNKYGHVFIEDENRQELENELEAWKIYGYKYIVESGVDESVDQILRFENRCKRIGADDLHSEFRTLRENIMINHDVLGKHDPYGETLSKRGKAIFDREINKNYRGLSTESKSKFAKKPKSTDGASPNTKYVSKATGGATKSSDGDMETLGGDGVLSNSPKNLNMGKFSNEASELKKVKVRSESAYSRLNALEEALAAIDSPEGEGVQPKKVHDTDGYTPTNKNVDSGLEGEDGHPIEPAEGEGLMSRKARSFDGYSPTNKNVGGGLEGEDGRPIEPGEGKGVAKRTVTDSDGRSGGKSFGESQYKWSTNATARRQSGRRKNKLFPKNRSLDEEVKVSVSGAGLDGNEVSYAATYPEGDPSEIITTVMKSMQQLGQEPEAPEEIEGMEGMEGGDEIEGTEGVEGAEGNEAGAGDADAETAKIEKEIEDALKKPDEIEGMEPEAEGEGEEEGAGDIQVSSPPAAPQQKKAAPKMAPKTK